MKFFDFTEFQLSMFGDTGVNQGVDVRGPSYIIDNDKVITCECNVYSL